MARNFKSLSDTEKKELQELIAKKKAKTLTDQDAKRLAELNEKCGFKGGKSSSKEGFRPGNDFSWWNKREDLLKDAANYKCDYIAGNELGDTYQFVLPGVLTVDLIDTFGISKVSTDPLNVWSRDLYLRMFQKFRVPNGYSHSDLGITIAATIMVSAMFAYYERVYGVINRYNIRNLNIPFAEARALGLNDLTADWLRSHLSDFRYDLNELIARAQRIVLPKDISLIADKISLYGYEYLDHQSLRSQIIMFRPKYYGVYSDTALKSGGSLRFNAIDYSDPGFFFNMAVDDETNMCTILEEMVNALVGSDSVNKIYADLVTWFGEDAMLHFVQVPEEYVVLPVYSESILHKLHNTEAFFDGMLEQGEDYLDLVASACPKDMIAADKTVVTSGYWVYQCNDTIISAPVFSTTHDTELLEKNDWTYPIGTMGGSTPDVVEHLLDTYHEDVTEETITEGVIFKYSTDRILKSGKTACLIKSCSFEIPCEFNFYSTRSENPVSTFYNNITDDDDIAASFAAKMALIDWAPLSYYKVDFRVGNSEIDFVYGDVDNVVMIPNTGLKKVHRAIVYSGLQTDIKVINK